MNTLQATLSGTVTITGNAIFGETLTAQTEGLASSPSLESLGTLSYQWKRNGAEITGATSPTYTLAQADIGATITVTVTAANCEGSVTSDPTEIVEKATQTAPAVPTMLSRTTTSITLNAMAGCEFSINGGTSWQPETEFSGLTPNTAYNFVARFAEIATHYASPASAPATFSTEAEGGGGEVTQSIELINGWNWVSCNVLNDNPTIFAQMKSSLNVVGEQIKGGDGNFVSQPFWMGFLTTISEKEMYQVKIKADHTMTLAGTQADPATTPITLNNGWNWIGYLPSFSATHAYALAGPHLQNGDIIKSTEGFATYYGFWLGSIDMQPGAGYMYYSSSSSPKTFYYPSTPSKSSSIAYKPSYRLKNTPERGRYANNMTVTSVVVKNNKEITGDWIEVSAFCGSDCRGSVLLRYEEVLGRYFGLLMVYGEGDELITLKVYDHLTGREYAAENAPFPFVSNEIAGSAMEPYVIDLGAEIGTNVGGDITINTDKWNPEEGDGMVKAGVTEAENLPLLLVYPNPAKDELRITNIPLQIFEEVAPQSGDGVVINHIEIYDMMGRLLKSEISNLKSEISIDVSGLAKGIYLLKVTYHNQQYQMVKFVKE